MRGSIHNPRFCLTGSGHRFINEYVYKVKLNETERLPLRIFETTLTRPDTFGESTTKQYVYAFWFFNPERETTGFLRRFLWLSYDDAIRGYRPRWAYVSIFMEADLQHPENHQRFLDDFVPLLHSIVNDLRKEMRDAERASGAASPKPPHGEFNTEGMSTGDVF